VGVLVVDCKIRLLTSDCLLIVLEKLVLVDAEERKVVPTAAKPERNYHLYFFLTYYLLFSLFLSSKIILPN
jgi:hypothetical protein